MSIMHILPSREDCSRLIHSLKTREWWLGIGLFVVGVIGTLGGLFILNQRSLITIPKSGGTHREGVVGTPRFINPILALSDTDKDLTSLVYSGLMREDEHGNLIPDLAQSYSVSEDGLTYTFTLKDGLKFHDGKKVTSADVVYTITTIKDPVLKSPRKINWDGVTAEAPDEHTVVFHLKQRYADFLENTTLGIMPAHLWKTLTPEQFSLSDLNLKGVGAGLYKITATEKNSSGIPDQIILRRALKETYIEEIVFKFYANQNDLIQGLEHGDVDSIASVDAKEARVLKGNGYTVISEALPRVFGVFLNPTEQPLFADRSVVEALNASINRTQLIETTLSGYGTPQYGPVPTQFLSEHAFDQVETTADPKAILTKGGWKQSSDGTWTKKDKKATTTLAFSLSTADIPELKDAAHELQTAFTAIGAKVDLKVYDSGTLNQSVIRPRKYEALLFGQMINHESDLYAFWHSSQRHEPGLNISQYANARVDKLLEQALGTLDGDTREGLYQTINDTIVKDAPAIFLYSPLFVYVTNNDTHGITFAPITIPADRFKSLRNWYIRVDRVWPIFARQTD